LGTTAAVKAKLAFMSFRERGWYRVSVAFTHASIKAGKSVMICSWQEHFQSVGGGSCNGGGIPNSLTKQMNAVNHRFLRFTRKSRNKVVILGIFSLQSSAADFFFSV
jgi:hypothetical protein